ALASDDPISGDIKMLGDQERVWQAHGTALRDSQGETLGAVIVVNDVTDYRRLENVRRDFVANVSHELKTPIASIKGFAETLLDGALDNRDDAERFCRIIARQSERLHSIIDDLLSLSRIEQSEGADDIALESTLLQDVLRSAISDCQPRADERAITIAVECPDQQRIRCNAPLLIQAVLNLLDNAIKYSDEGGRIDVQVQTTPRSVVIAVRDQGCGIPPEHLPRVFERFYRVDRARSRKLGGTGLGLSIVKHIVNVHHGKVTVESTPGKGSTFSIQLPVEASFAVPLIKA
ncbi:MAG: GHKL domain-containing protein, partial [Planctomycetaceae bacterium]|nr:GHKL domain-containing protein [Planctomycetaceae bacterium]